MSLISSFIKRLIQKRRAENNAGVEELRTVFKARYHEFKLLLNANDKALEIMAEMEAALTGARPFGMSFVLSRSTRVATNVWQMVNHLNRLSPGRYERLFHRFKGIQMSINSYLRPGSIMREGPLVLPFESVDKDLLEQVGAKIANLCEIKNRLGLQVSNGFAITAHAYQRFMNYTELSSEIDRLIQAGDVDRLDRLYRLSSTIQQLIIKAPLPVDLEEAIQEQYRILEEKDGKEVRVAMRSSAIGEDFSETSFAGQYRSQLNVNKEHITEAYKEVVASMYTLQAMSYRLNRGIRDDDVPMCVACMSMANAVSGGVVYSRNPVDMRSDRIVINSVWGLPKPVVDGSTASDLFVLTRDDPPKILRKKVAMKHHEFTCYEDEGVCRLDTMGDKAAMASLDDAQARRIVRLAVKLEEYYQIPQDIEWAMDAYGSIIVLQCRPLKQMDVSKVRAQERMREEEAGAVILRGGITASSGAGSGPVHIVSRDVDALQFPKGAVLVTLQSLPRWATLLDRAAAVVAERGSIASHLANVAREFRVPALFGMKGALGQLKNGQVITVDADGLRVYEGCNETVLRDQKTRKNLMAGSSVYAALKGVAQHIVPLNLLDPDSPRFRPDNCRTFHDITRFCHEKAVQEMFSFGKEHHFPERSSKQLVCDVPMQWWILNLDDGFYEEVEGKYVKLENIASIPMLDLWEGITAIPWEGPPAIDGKGFISVMFQATTNTALITGSRSKYGERNYFMISKNYCSMTSRFGFHFSIVESLVSERPGENYVSFQFKGGAADLQRRQKRIQFIGRMLERYGFRIHAREDSLMARLEDMEEAFMRNRLKILGYLLTHTRQLDMIMADESRVNHYRSKMEKDIQDQFHPDEAAS